MFKKLIEMFVCLTGKVHWPTKRYIDSTEQDKIRDLLTHDYFIILTRRNNHLSSYLISLADWVLTGKWGYWSHVLMNLEDRVENDADFRLVDANETIALRPAERILIEATGEGTHISPFEKVFDVQNVALLKPKCMDLAEWTLALDTAKKQLGKPYDSLFNIADDRALSCVELVRIILKSRPKYNEEFAELEALIKKRKNLSPQMFYDCGDFEVVFNTRAV